MSCCTNRFKQDSGIGFYSIPARQVQCEVWLKAISQAGWEAKSSDHLCDEHFVSGRHSRDPKNVDYVRTHTLQGWQAESELQHT